MFSRRARQEPYEIHSMVLLKLQKEKKRYRGDNKCRLESIRTMWNCSQKGEPATRVDQKKYIMSREKLNNTIIYK